MVNKIQLVGSGRTLPILSLTSGNWLLRTFQNPISQHKSSTQPTQITNPMPDPLQVKPLYIVAFESKSNAQEYQPVIAALPSREDGTLPLLFDGDLAPCIPALWFCLHLPPTMIDLLDLDASVLQDLQKWEQNHEILLLPLDAVGHFNWEEMRKQYVPVLILSPDEIQSRASNLSHNINPLLGCVSTSELSQDLIDLVWIRIGELVPGRQLLSGSITQIARLDSAPWILPARHLLRQFQASDVDEPAEEGRFDDSKLDAFRVQNLRTAVARLELAGCGPEEFEARLGAEMAAAMRSKHIHVAVFAPGIAPAYRRSLKALAEPASIADWPRSDHGPSLSANPSTWSDYQIERAVGEFCLTHRSLARSGMGLMLPSIPKRAWIALAELEEHCRLAAIDDWRVDAQAIRRWLAIIAMCGNDLFSDADVMALNSASFITAFSNFPLGLLATHIDRAPLVCKVPMALRPLVPLSRTLQQELMAPPILDLSRGARVLVAECIPQSDLVGRLSRRAWEPTEQVIAGSTQVVIEHAECLCPEELRAAIERNRPDILVISAHGFYRPENNVAGLMIGETPVLGAELGNMPPCVILSACHAGPRGVGAVTIPDLLYRQGAATVLATIAPVDVRHNSTLIGRLFVNLSEAIEGRISLRTFADAWHHVATGNAVVDVLLSSNRWAEWGWSRDQTGTSPIEEFQTIRSKGRLHTSTIYGDTVGVLSEIADERGVGPAFRQWVRTQGFVPETLFYTLLGWPERILLRDEVLEKARAESFPR